MAHLNGPAIKNEILDELMKSVKNPDDLLGEGGLLRQLTARLVEKALQAELTSHLGYDAGQARPEGASNGRNGYTSKTLLTDQGEVTVDVPRDREGSFEPQLVRKRERRLTGFDDRILALYARGMSVRDIKGHLQEMYGVEVSPDLISRVTDAVMEDVAAWQSRPLDTVYPIVYLDAIVVKTRDQGVVRNKSVYIALGVTVHGNKEVLGLWIEPTEGAKFWLKVVNELKTRGIQDVLILCCDGLKGFPEAIEAVYPKAVVQTCIVHMIRNSVRFVSYKDRRELVRDLETHRRCCQPRRRRARARGIRGAMGPTLRDDWRCLAEQLGARRAVPGLPAGNPPHHLHDQRHRVPQLEPAEAGLPPRPLPLGRGSDQALVPGPAQPREALEPLRSRVEQGSRSIRHLLRRTPAVRVNRQPESGC